MGHSWIMMLALPMIMLSALVLDSWVSADLAQAKVANAPARVPAGRALRASV